MNKFKKIFFIILIASSIIYIFLFFYDAYKKQSNLLNDISIENAVETQENIISEGSESETPNEQNETPTKQEDSPSIDIDKKNERIIKVKELQKENSDIIGWIEIENTDINYPVLQTSNNSYYMTHNYKKQYSKNGSIFLDKDYKWNPPSSNLLIYGHNMKSSNAMFKGLLKYSSKKYYQQHPTIRFTTNNEDSTFEIISVFKSRVYYKSEKNVFRYYYFINSNNENEFNEFVNNAKNSSLYDTGKTAVYGEQLMTLSTCSYHTTDGRFVIVAKKI